jgi:hypothetical protein
MSCLLLFLAVSIYRGVWVIVLVSLVGVLIQITGSNFPVRGLVYVPMLYFIMWMCSGIGIQPFKNVCKHMIVFRVVVVKLVDELLAVKSLIESTALNCMVDIGHQFPDIFYLLQTEGKKRRNSLCLDR